MLVERRYYKEDAGGAAPAHTAAAAAPGAAISLASARDERQRCSAPRKAARARRAHRHLVTTTIANVAQDKIPVRPLSEVLGSAGGSVKLQVSPSSKQPSDAGIPPLGAAK